MRVKLRKVGTSIGAIFPSEELKKRNVGEGDFVDIFFTKSSESEEEKSDKRRADET